MNLHIRGGTVTSNFEEDFETTEQIEILLRRGKELNGTFSYPKVAEIYLKIIRVLDQNSYPSNHKLRLVTLKLLNDTHHAIKSLDYSAKIVDMGLKHERSGDYTKALKMYTIAFRIRRDCVGYQHPSLPSLLNMLGAVQVKRGEHAEAMRIFEIALHGNLKKNSTKDINENKRRRRRTSSTAVSMKEIGSIYEYWGDLDGALSTYHNSVNCAIAQYSSQGDTPKCISPGMTFPAESLSVRIVNVSTISSSLSDEMDEEVEAYLQEDFDPELGLNNPTINQLESYYNSFFRSKEIESKKLHIHVVTTLHKIGNVHKK